MTPLVTDRSRQGDPMSPLLFNLIIEKELPTLNEDIGYAVGDALVKKWHGVLLVEHRLAYKPV